MTVTLSKRLFEDASASMTSPPASKKLRLLAPLSEHLVSSGHHKPGSAGLVPVQQQQHSTARKRRHDTGTDSTAGTASPCAITKRGKRADGRSSTAAASPNSAKSALEALLTCEGLEKDHDVEAEVAYLNNRQAAAATGGATSSDAAGPSNNGAPASSSPSAAAAAGSSGLPAQDAARSSREKRRDQDQNPRARRASAGGRSTGGRDQVGSPSSPDNAPQPSAAAEDEPCSPRVMLDLVGDKEWQRLFAVLTISDVATSRHSGSGTSGAQGSTAAAAGRPGTASHRFAPALGAPSDSTAAAAPMQEAPSTPVRVEGVSSSSQQACEVTPSRRSSFLMGEFNRVQQMRLSTPTPPPAAAAAAAGPVFCNSHVPYLYAHDSMAV